MCVCVHAQDYNDHVAEISAKLVAIMDSLFEKALFKVSTHFHTHTRVSVLTSPLRSRLSCGRSCCVRGVRSGQGAAIKRSGSGLSFFSSTSAVLLFPDLLSFIPTAK